jgi:predicted DNA-binding transcriptional regulator AlpA
MPPRRLRVEIAHEPPDVIRVIPLCRLAEAFDVSAPTLRTIIAASDFPRIFVLGPTRRYVREADIVAWIERRQQAAEQPAIAGDEQLAAYADKVRNRKAKRGSPTKRGFAHEEAALSMMIRVTVRPEAESPPRRDPRRA